MHGWRWNKNEYSKSDNPFWFEQEQGFFYSFDRFQLDTYSLAQNQTHLSLLYSKISISEEIEIYERSVFTFFDLVGQIGGIYELLEVSAAFFVGYYNSNMLNFKLVNKLNSWILDDQKEAKHDNREDQSHELIQFNRQNKQVVRNKNESMPYLMQARSN